MFEEIRFRRALKKLQAEEAQAYDLVFKGLRSREDSNTLSTVAEHMKTAAEGNRKVHTLVTSYLVNKATRYLIPIPEISDPGVWEIKPDASPPYAYLSRAGIAMLRTQIQNHEKDERERIGFWITSLIGVLGAIIGVVGVLIAYRALK